MEATVFVRSKINVIFRSTRLATNMTAVLANRESDYSSTLAMNEDEVGITMDAHSPGSAVANEHMDVPVAGPLRAAGKRIKVRTSDRSFNIMHACLYVVECLCGFPPICISFHNCLRTSNADGEGAL